MGRPFVLVIEPEPFIRLDVAETVSGMGYVVNELAGSDAALRFIDHSDRAGPDDHGGLDERPLDGHGLIERARSRWPRLPAIILTAGDDDPSLRNETTALVQKPFSPEAIEKSVQEVTRPAS